MVERARYLLSETNNRRGVAFLSFTTAAVGELEARLRALQVLPVPLFPSYIGTFDAFLWQFLTVPFGIPGSDALPRLIPDKSKWPVEPFAGAQPLPLSCFNRLSGKVDEALAKNEGFDISERNIAPYEKHALMMSTDARNRGFLDFDDVRDCISERLKDDLFAQRVGAALAARFREIVVDEAQDCNRSDLGVVSWLRRSGIVVKVICDPHQSIYEFRGGVTDELYRFADTFSLEQRLSLTGNFRSSPAICAAIVSFREPNHRDSRDRPAGEYQKDATPVHILSYAGSSVPPTIGSIFAGLANGLGIPLHDAVVLAATRDSGSKAIGHPNPGTSTHPTLALAQAVMDYHFSFAAGNRRDALTHLHRVTLRVRGHIRSEAAYNRYIVGEGLTANDWRSEIIGLANALRYDPNSSVEAWLQKARDVTGVGMLGKTTINQRLPKHRELQSALAEAPALSPSVRTIHAAKGLEFEAVCVVLTVPKTGGILDLLEGIGANGRGEDVRKIYVAISRAKKLLVLATPKNRVAQLQRVLAVDACPTAVHKI